jgi:uncharacterized protein (DUF1499 family)
MLRRSVIEELPSPLALWSARLALFGAAVAVLSIIIVRSGILEIAPAVATFGAALVFAVAAIVLAFASFVAIWINGAPGLGRAFLGFFVGLALIAYPAFIAVSARKLPQINDITTDFTNPPRFDVLARLRPRDRIDYPKFFGDQQRKGYPDIVPLQLELPTRTAYDLALKIVTGRKWLVLDQRPPAGPRPGTIEAVARTTVMGFRDDVVVRVSAIAAGSRIDVRSASRYGLSDFGTNATRIRALLTEIEEAANDLPEPRVEEKQPEKPPPKRPPRRCLRGKPVDAIDRCRPVGRDETARDQILHMRQHRERGRAGQPRVDADIDRAHDCRDVGRALVQPMQDRGFARLAVQDVIIHEALGFRNGRPVPREVQILVAPHEFEERRHVVAHGAVGRRHDRCRPAHHVIAGEEDALAA